jgi:hypothetical protein
VHDPGLIDRIRDVWLDHLQPVIDAEDLRTILLEFKRLCATHETIYQCMVPVTGSTALSG